MTFVALCGCATPPGRLDELADLLDRTAEIISTQGRLRVTPAGRDLAAGIWSCSHDREQDADRILFSFSSLEHSVLASFSSRAVSTCAPEPHHPSGDDGDDERAMRTRMVDTIGVLKTCVDLRRHESAVRSSDPRTSATLLAMEARLRDIACAASSDGLADRSFGIHVEAPTPWSGLHVSGLVRPSAGDPPSGPSMLTTTRQAERWAEGLPRMLRVSVSPPTTTETRSTPVPWIVDVSPMTIPDWRGEGVGDAMSEMRAIARVGL